MSVVNLGFNNEGAYAYRLTLDDFSFLDYDVAMFFDGYNDLKGDDARNTSLFRHDSPIFQLTGYYPILPLVFAEKAMLLRTGGDLMAGYAALRGEEKTVFKPSLADRASATALESTVAVTESLGRQLGRFSSPPVAPLAPAERQKESHSGCAYPWSFYCQSMHAAVRHALDLNKRVIVVLQPLPALSDARAARVAADRARPTCSSGASVRSRGSGSSISPVPSISPIAISVSTVCICPLTASSVR